MIFPLLSLLFGLVRSLVWFFLPPRWRSRSPPLFWVESPLFLCFFPPLSFSSGTWKSMPKTIATFNAARISAALRWNCSQGVGGSEEAMVLLSRRLAARGYHVEVYGHPADSDIGSDDHGVVWYPAHRYIDAPTPDTFVSWGCYTCMALAGDEVMRTERALRIAETCVVDLPLCASAIEHSPTPQSSPSFLSPFEGHFLLPRLRDEVTCSSSQWPRARLKSTLSQVRVKLLWLHDKVQPRLLSPELSAQITHVMTLSRHHLEQLPPHARHLGILTSNGLDEALLPTWPVPPTNISSSFGHASAANSRQSFIFASHPEVMVAHITHARTDFFMHLGFIFFGLFSRIKILLSTPSVIRNLQP